MSLTRHRRRCELRRAFPFLPPGEARWEGPFALSGTGMFSANRRLSPDLVKRKIAAQTGQPSFALGVDKALLLGGQEFGRSTTNASADHLSIGRRPRAERRRNESIIHPFHIGKRTLLTHALELVRRQIDSHKSRNRAHGLRQIGFHLFEGQNQQIRQLTIFPVAVEMFLPHNQSRVGKTDPQPDRDGGISGPNITSRTK